ncbi:MAG: hypothetical protein MHM6MM_004033 [Cercozoa sp. M6MM]
MLAIGALLLAVLAIACIWLVCFKLTTRRYLAQGLRSIGVATKRVWRTVKELRRKSFHLLGVLFPTLYWFGLQAGILTRASASVIVCAIVCINFLIEILRKVSPQFAHFYETKLAKGILRAKERNRVTGMLFFSLGVFLSITFFPVRISIAAILFLVCGDLAAAMVGVSFGRTKIVGKKSLEGFLAMFVVCFVIAFVIFKYLLLSMLNCWYTVSILNSSAETSIWWSTLHSWALSAPRWWSCWSHSASMTTS